MRLSIAVIAQDLYRKQIRAEKEEASRATGQVSGKTTPEQQAILPRKFLV